MQDYRNLGTIILTIGVLLLGYGLYMMFSTTEQVVEGVSGQYVAPMHKMLYVFAGIVMMVAGFVLNSSKKN